MLRKYSLIVLCGIISTNAQNTTSPTKFPTFLPTLTPSSAPSLAPSFAPTFFPTAIPTSQPTTSRPTTSRPTTQPTLQPTFQPTLQPTVQPTAQPTLKPTLFPTYTPTSSPTVTPAILAMSVYGGPSRKLESFSQTFTDFSQNLNLWPFFRLVPQCAGSQASCDVYVNVKNSTSASIIEYNATNKTIALSDVVGGNITIKTDLNTSRVIYLVNSFSNTDNNSDTSNNNIIINVRGSQTNQSSLFTSYGIFSPFFARTDVYNVNTDICAQFVVSSLCPTPSSVSCTIQNTTTTTTTASFSSQQQPVCDSTIWSTYLAKNMNTSPLPFFTSLYTPRFFQFDLIAPPSLSYGFFSSSLASPPLSTSSTSSSTISTPIFSLADSFNTTSNQNIITLYVWGDSILSFSSFLSYSGASFFINSPSFQLQPTYTQEPFSILLISPSKNCSAFVRKRGGGFFNSTELCYMESLFDIYVICTQGDENNIFSNSNSNNSCGVSVISASISTNPLFAMELTEGSAAGKSIRADALANLQIEQTITLFFTTSSNTYSLSILTPYIVQIILYGSLDNITFSPVLLVSDNVISDFNNTLLLYQFPASRFYAFAFNCSCGGRVSISFLLGALLPCTSQPLLPNVFTTPVFQPLVPITPISIQEEHSSNFYSFQPYVQTINSIVFRGAQEENGVYNIIDFVYDSKIKNYQLAVPQWYTLVATITPCPQTINQYVPCQFSYDTPTSKGIGNGTQETPPLRMQTLAEIFSSSNSTSNGSMNSNSVSYTYPVVILTVSLPNASTTFELSLSSTCMEGYFYPSISGPVVCADPNHHNSSCCPCPLFAVCQKNSTRPVALPGYQQKSREDFTMVRCDPFDACVGDGRCADGYTGVACSQCDTHADPPRYRVNYECQKCPNEAGIVIIIGIIIFLFFLLLFLKISKPDYTKKYTLSITLAFAQIVSIFASFPVSWPLTTLFLFDLFSFLNFNIDLFSPDCAIKMDFFSKWILKIMLPVICAGVFAIIYGLVKVFPKLRKIYISFMIWDIEERCAQRVDRKRLGEEQKEIEELWTDMQTEKSVLSRDEAARQWEEEHLGERFIHALVTAAVVAYTFLAKTASEPLNCVSQTGGVSHIRADPAAYCDGNWYVYAGISYLAIIVYTVGIPVVFSFVLIRAWRTKTLDDPVFYYKFGHLVLPYRPIYWYWEIVQMSRKLITVLLIEFFANASGENTKMQINSVLIVLVFFLALQEFAKPYEFSWCNRVAFTWNTFTLIVLMSALLFSFSELSSELSVAYGLALLAAAGFTVFVSLYAFLQELRRARSRRVLFLGTNQLAKEKEEQELLTVMFGSNLAKSLHRKTRDLPPTQRNFMYRRLGIWHEAGADSGISEDVEMTNGTASRDSSRR